MGGITEMLLILSVPQVTFQFSIYTAQWKVNLITNEVSDNWKRANTACFTFKHFNHFNVLQPYQIPGMNGPVILTC